MKKIISILAVYFLAFTMIVSTGNVLLNENKDVVFADSISSENPSDSTQSKDDDESLKHAKEQAITKVDALYRPRGVDKAKDDELKAVLDGIKEQIKVVHNVNAIDPLLKIATDKANSYEAVYENGRGWNGKRVLISLKYMGIGMLCIFAVIGIIVLTIVILNKATASKNNNEASEE